MAASLLVDIVEPTGSIFRGEVQRFRAPGTEGSFEILKDHAPMLVETRIGPVFITTPNGDRILFAASSGFVQVVDNRIIMIVEAAEPASDIDVDRAKKAEDRAKEGLKEGLEIDRRHAESALERARNRLRVAMGQVGRR
ncbi:MAG: ATP synthase F1 subunit epsilon [Rhodothermia bacterium]